MYVDIVRYRAMISFGVSETTPWSCELLYVDIRHYLPMIGFAVSRDHSLVLRTMYVDIVHYLAMIGFGVYIHSSQEERVVSETPTPIIAR